MKNDLKAILDMYRDKYIPWWTPFLIGLTTLICLPLALIWRAICGIIMMICGVCKIFKRKEKHTHDTHYNDRCPKCGSPLTVYNHETIYHEDTGDTSYYIFCACGYDSREE